MSGVADGRSIALNAYAFAAEPEPEPEPKPEAYTNQVFADTLRAGQFQNGSC